MKNVNIIKELERISADNGGLLQPEVVVRAARNPKSPLHSQFEWDDSIAAEQHRLWQARALINVCVQIIPGVSEPVPCFVSLTSDRKEGRGYRLTTAVMSDREMRDQLLNDALHDLNTFQKRFSRLKELAGVFSEIRKLRKKAA